MFVGVGPFDLNNGPLAQFISYWAEPNCWEKPNASLLFFFCPILRCFEQVRVHTEDNFNSYHIQTNPHTS